jgi:hypothetical protein
MTQATTIYHPVCPQWYSIFEVPASDPDNTRGYMVITNGPGGPKFCTCPAFRYSGGYGEQHCKHIDAVLMHGCFWMRPGNERLKPGTNTINYHGIRILDSAKNVTTEDCPGCGALMISTGREE